MAAAPVSCCIRHRHSVPSDSLELTVFRRCVSGLLSIVAAGAAALARAACGSNTSAAGPRRRRTRAGPRRRRRRGARSSTAKVTQKDVPVDIAAIGNVEAYATHLASARRSPASLERTVVPRRRLRQEGRAALHASIGGRSRRRSQQAEANLVRDEALLAQAEAQLTRDAANAEYMQLTRRAPGAARSRAASSRRTSAEQARVAGRRDRRRSSRPTRRPSRAPGRSSSRSRRAVDTAQRVSSTTRRSSRRSTAAPATSRVKVGNLVTANHDRADDDRAGRSRCYVTFSVPAMHLPHDQAAHDRRASCRSPRRRRTPTRSRRPARSPSSTTPSTRRPTRSS